MSKKVAIIGAGVAGLTAALVLKQKGIKFHIYESKKHVGGRIATDRENGYIFDRGFQILLNSYPACKKYLNYEKLQLFPFKKGAIIRQNGEFHIVAIPSDKSSIKPKFNLPFMTSKDYFSLMKAWWVVQGMKAEIPLNDNQTAAQKLEEFGFSEKLITHFFKPFFGGVLLDNSLQAKGVLIPYICKMFLTGDGVLPYNGMQAIPEQLAENVGYENISLNQEAIGIEDKKIFFNDKVIDVDFCLLATDVWQANQLIKSEKKDLSRGVWCFYFSAPKSPINEPLIVLNGENAGIIQYLVVMTDVCPHYSKNGDALVAVTVVNHMELIENELLHLVSENLKGWFSEEFKDWSFLKSYKISHAHPYDYPIQEENKYQINSWVYRCGDYLETPSIQSAMDTGEKAALEIAAHIND